MMTNLDLRNVHTPVKVAELATLYKETHFDTKKSEQLINGFTSGFDLGYRGDENVKIRSPNLKFTVGSKFDLWSKIMKEVSEKRLAGPFYDIPYESYIQSPIGLVPKDGNKTRLIFHLSYPKGGTTSVNINSLDGSVKYPEFDQAIRLCLEATKILGECYLGKSDMTSAFRHLPINPAYWKYLVMKAQHPTTGIWYFFVDKCLPFGSTRSCAIFQSFSDSISHIMFVKTGFLNINYLDDFLFIGYAEVWCNDQIDKFVHICHLISFPLSAEKTHRACTSLTFLGLLIDGKRKQISIPIDKIERALSMIKFVATRKKIKLKQLQKLCGFLNFLCKGIIPGRVFLRRMYAMGKNATKPDHHVNVTREFKLDLDMWASFMTKPSIFSRPFFEFDLHLKSTEIDWFTDASKLGMGGVCSSHWFIAEWEDNFITHFQPSINYLELFALTVSILSWVKGYENGNITIFCDNQSVVHMLNSNTSKCHNCMVLLRLIVLECMKVNARVRCKHVLGVRNKYADHLSRLNYGAFRKLAKLEAREFDRKSTRIPVELWPPCKLYSLSNEEKHVRKRKAKLIASLKG